MTSPHHHLPPRHHNPQRLASSSSSSRSYSSNSSSSIIQQPPARPTRTFEQVWNDIHLCPPYNHHLAANIPNSPSMILQDFLAVGPSKNPATSSAPPDNHTGLHLRPPATILSLNSSFDFHYLDPRCRLQIGETGIPTTIPTANNNSNNQTTNIIISDNTPSPFAKANSLSEDMGSASLGFFPFGGKKRSAEQQQMERPADGGGDRRHKRMMKNRESAARSRARKQAYTNELEVAVNSLTQENATLRRMHDELRVAMAAQLPTKKTLLRTSTAPF